MCWRLGFMGGMLILGLLICLVALFALEFTIVYFMLIWGISLRLRISLLVLLFVWWFLLCFWV